MSRRMPSDREWSLLERCLNRLLGHMEREEIPLLASRVRGPDGRTIGGMLLINDPDLYEELEAIAQGAVPRLGEK